MLQARSWLPRTEGSLRLELARSGSATRLEVLRQEGASRARFPRAPEGAPPEVVLINMAGGLTGGDHIDLQVTLQPGAEASVTTAAAEKIYRAQEGEATIRARLSIGEGARLAWLPQPTILFDRSRLDRHTEVELAGNANFLGVETLIFGRTAMGEDVHRGACRDAWRIRRDGALIFADAFRLDGAVAAVLDRPATLAGARATAMLIYVATDAAARLDAARAVFDHAQSVIGVSTWNGMLVARAAARDGQILQADIARLVQLLSGQPPPRVWQC